MTLPPDILLQLRDHVSHRPDQHFLTFVDDAGRDQQSVTYAAWDAAVRDLAGALVTHHGFQAGDHALLVYPPSMDFTVAFGACLVAGIIPVPVAPPDPLDPQAGMNLFRALCEDCAPRAILTSTPYQLARRAGTVRSWLTSWGGPGWPSVPWIDTRTVKRAPRMQSTFAASPDSVALLQYTSGSTSRPKGVPLTHGNLAHQFTIHADRCLMSPGIRAAIWLPHFHDYFLVSSFLAILFHGGQMWFCSPMSFLKRPALWFDLAHRIRATHTAAPNFAYEMVLAKTTPAERSAWDLSCIRQHLCGAEPIRATTFARFHEAFACTGLDPATFAPGYGLAEHTVAVTTAGVRRARVDVGALEREHRLVPSAHEASSRVLIGCGPVVGDIDLRIVHPETRVECPPGHIGEVWVDSPSKGPGYHGQPAATAQTFHARLQPDHGGEYLRTGDLGALFDGELYITGRLKEVVIVRGRNLYPHDLEATAATLEGVRPGGALAFAVHDGEVEGYGLLVEPRVPRRRGTTAAERNRLNSELAAELHVLLARTHHVAPTVILVGPRGTVPKTTSGKLQRHTLAQRFRVGDPTLLERVTTHSAPRTPGAERLHGLQQLLAEVGHVDVHPDTALRDLGLDSIQVVALSAALDEAGFPQAFERLLGDGTIGDLAELLPPDEDPDRHIEPLALSSFQRALLRDVERCPGTHVLSLPFTFQPAPDASVLIHALHDLIAHHPLLGLAYRDEQTFEGAPLHVPVHDSAEEDVASTLCELGAMNLPLAHGPAMAADLVQHGDSTTVLLRLSHLAYDTDHSLELASHWLELVHARLTGDVAPAHHTADTTGFRQWETAARQNDTLVRFWRERLAGAGRIPLPNAPLTHHRLDSTPLSLDTRRMQRRTGGSAFNVVLTAYQLALARVFTLDDVVVAASVSQRHRADFQTLDGPVVHYVACRETPRGSVLDRFLDGLTSTRRALQHSALPLEDQLAAADLPPYTDNIGLQASVNLYDLASSPRGAEVTRLRSGTPQPLGNTTVRCPALPVGYPAPRPYPMMLTLFSGPRGVSGHLRTHPERVSPHQAEAIVRAMQHILEIAETTPGASVSAWLAQRPHSADEPDEAPARQRHP